MISFSELVRDDITIFTDDNITLLFLLWRFVSRRVIFSRNTGKNLKQSYYVILVIDTVWVTGFLAQVIVIKFEN